MCDINYRLAISSAVERKPGMTLEHLCDWVGFRDVSERRLLYKAIDALRSLGSIKIKNDRAYPEGYPI